MRVADNLHYLDNHSFLQMNEENKLIPYMLILMGINFPVGDPRSVCYMGMIEISNSKIVNMLFKFIHDESSTTLLLM